MKTHSAEALRKFSRKGSENWGLRKRRGIRKAFLAAFSISTMDMFAEALRKVNCSAGPSAEVKTMAAEVARKCSRKTYVRIKESNRGEVLATAHMFNRENDEQPVDIGARLFQTLRRI